MQETLAKRQDKEYLANALTTLFAHPEKLWTKEYRHQIETNEELLVQLLFEINNTLTEKQRKKVIKRLKSFTKDLRSLADD